MSAPDFFSSAASFTPASSTTSEQTIFAPSLANKRQATAPMPCAPPVMMQTLSLSLIGTSSAAFEVTLAFPAADGLVISGRFHARGVKIVIHDVLAESLARGGALLERRDRFMQRAGHAKQILAGVGVAHELRRRLFFRLDALQAR